VPGIFVQEALEPGDRFGVEMVGRLVEQKHVGLGQQQPAQRDAPTLAARERGDVGIPRRESKGVGGDFERALEIVPVGGLDQILEFRLLLRQGIEVRVRIGIGRIDRVEPLQRILDMAERLLDVAPNVFGRVKAGLLGQKPILMPGCGRASPSISVSRPAMMRNKVDLPEPFNPSTPILAPGKKDKEMSRRMTRLGGTILPTRFIVKIY
jgi:hypothetical protein